MGTHSKEANMQAYTVNLTGVQIDTLLAALDIALNESYKQADELRYSALCVMLTRVLGR